MLILGSPVLTQKARTNWFQVVWLPDQIIAMMETVPPDTTCVSAESAALAGHLPGFRSHVSEQGTVPYLGRGGERIKVEVVKL